MAAMLNMTGQGIFSQILKNIVLFEYTDAIYDKTNDLYHFSLLAMQ